MQKHLSEDAANHSCSSVTQGLQSRQLVQAWPGWQRWKTGCSAGWPAWGAACVPSASDIKAATLLAWRKAARSSLPMTYPCVFVCGGSRHWASRKQAWSLTKPRINAPGMHQIVGVVGFNAAATCARRKFRSRDMRETTNSAGRARIPCGRRGKRLSWQLPIAPFFNCLES